MTQHEFVKKLSRMEGKLLFGLAEESESMLIAKEEFKNGYLNGLTKGLEIVKEFLDWLIEHYHYSGGGWYVKCSKSMVSFTTDELLTIFLTEKYGNNG